MKTITFVAAAAGLMLGAPLHAQDFTVNGGVSHITGTGGQELYNNVCSACHLADGSGAVGAGSYPALKDNPNLEFPDYAMFVILHGQKGMPPLRAVLHDDQVAEILNYIRTEMNSFEGKTTAEEVKAARESN